MALNGLERMTRKILAEAEAEASAILAEAEEECKRIRADFDARAEEIRARLTKDAENEGAMIVSRAKAASATRRSQALLAARAEMIDETFAAAFAQLRAMPDDKYTEVLAGLLCTALAEQQKAELSAAEEAENDPEAKLSAPVAYEVLFNDRDRGRVGSAVIESARRRMGARMTEDAARRLILSEQTAAIDGGLILRCGEVETNCSFAVLFAELRREYEGEVARVLFEAPRKG